MFVLGILESDKRAATAKQSLSQKPFSGRDERCESKILGRRGAPPSRLGTFTRYKRRGTRIVN